jgi:glycosyltransferase involved in cell wall biosynthesis
MAIKNQYLPMDNLAPELSIVITLLNERDNIQPLLAKLDESLAGLSHEVIMVDDGSTDGTSQVIMKYANTDVRLVKLNKNYGQSAAMAAGIMHATGNFIVTMDGDLQNDPADIPLLLEKIKSDDFDLVAGCRAHRKDNFLFRKIPSKLANQFIRFLSGVRISDYGCSLKIFRSKLAKELGLYGELHRFIPILAQMQGARIVEMNVLHHPRIYGKSKYGLGRTLRVLSDLMLLLFFQKYVQKPMHLFGTMGLVAVILGVLINFYLLIEKIMGHDIWGRPLLLLGVILLLGGIQLITFGFMAELQMRTYYESQDKVPFKVKEVLIGKISKDNLVEV